MIFSKKTGKYIVPLLLGICLLIGSLSSFSSLAAKKENNPQRVYDYANCLTKEEKKTLEQESQKYYEDTKNNYLIVTTTTREEYSFTPGTSLENDCELYSEAFYDAFIAQYGEEYTNCTILTLDLSENRYADISGQGQLKQKLDSQRCKLASKKLVSALHYNKYFSACKKYMKTVNRYQQIKPGVNPDSIFLKVWFQLLVALIVAGICIGIMIYHSGGTMTATASTYLDSKRSQVVNKHDHFIRTTTHRRKIETDNSSSGSSGGGSSSGGSHGGSHF